MRLEMNEMPEPSGMSAVPPPPLAKDGGAVRGIREKDANPVSRSAPMHGVHRQDAQRGPMGEQTA